MPRWPRQLRPRIAVELMEHLLDDGHHLGNIRDHPGSGRDSGTAAGQDSNDQPAAVRPRANNYDSIIVIFHSGSIPRPYGSAVNALFALTRC